MRQQFHDTTLSCVSLPRRFPCSCETVFFVMSRLVSFCYFRTHQTIPEHPQSLPIAFQEPKEAPQSYTFHILGHLDCPCCFDVVHFCLFACPFVCPSACCFLACPSGWHSVCLSVLSISLCLSASLCLCLSVPVLCSCFWLLYVSVCLSLSLSLSALSFDVDMKVLGSAANAKRN